MSVLYRKVFVETKFDSFIFYNELEFCWFSVFDVLKVAFWDANFEIIYVVFISIEM